MAHLLQGIHRDQNARLLGALLGSARRRNRELLRALVTSARTARTAANQLAYASVVSRFRRADAADRPTFYQNYKGALTSAEHASEAIIKAAIEAGAQDLAIIAYVTDDFFSSVSSFMMSSFGQSADAGRKALRRGELQALEDNTSVQAKALGQRVQQLRTEVERSRGGMLERLKLWLAG